MKPIRSGAVGEPCSARCSTGECGRSFFGHRGRQIVHARTYSARLNHPPGPMATQDEQQPHPSAATPDIGDFPFPLSDGPEESQYLTWVRNHSSYMVPHGFLDYLRTVAVLARGIIVNFLIFLPILLVVAIPLGVFHFRMLDHPFYPRGRTRARCGRRWKARTRGSAGSSPGFRGGGPARTHLRGGTPCVADTRAMPCGRCAA